MSYSHFSKSKTVLLALVSTFVLASCSNKNSGSLNNSADSSGIFSTRPTDVKLYVTTIKLKTPALFAHAQPTVSADGKVVDTNVKKSATGKAEINKDRAAAIEAEQTQTVQKLAEISSEIKVIFKLKYVINGLVIVVPADKVDELKKVTSIARIEHVSKIARPMLASPMNAKSLVKVSNDFTKTSVKFIGTETAWSQNFKGQGMKVGIIDTGIDYTHKMLGGSGNPEEFTKMNKAEASPLFPNAKVVGGYDFAGTEFNSGSENFLLRIPKPDVNPMDEGGHGTHVAGSVAGVGDGVNTYDGVAPEATLYALKVFGADGSTDDGVVIAALDYAADPNKDGNLDDQLEVVNLSLGSGFGNPHIMYAEAIRNLTLGGTVVVASAGNSGPTDYIVGSPSVSEEALSVAAGIDDSLYNWQFSAVRIDLAAEKSIVVEAMEASTTKPLAEYETLKGKLVYAGLADKDFSEELKAQLKGNIAFIDRGAVVFTDKIKRAQDAGAIAVVVANNVEGPAFIMGGDGKFENIAAVMVTLDVGNQIKLAMKAGDVVVDLKEPQKIVKPEIIDTLTDFSSKGPRSFDSGFKPEITAPGFNIISAEMGGGDKGVKMSGTSMSGPHMAGVMALMKQIYPTYSVVELKSVVMGTTKSIGEKDVRYPLSRQGAGRVQVDKALNVKLVSQQPSIALGAVGIGSVKTVMKSVTLTNKSAQKMVVKPSWLGSELMKFDAPAAIEVEANSSKVVNFKWTILADKITARYSELDGWVILKSNDQEVLRLGTMAVAHKLSNVEASDLKIHAMNEFDSAGSLITLNLKNSFAKGDVLLFNYLASDDRKPFVDDSTTRDCDLQAAGYKIVNKGGKDVLQIAAKTYRMHNTWNTCELSVLFDHDQDGVVDQELVAQTWTTIPGAKPDTSVLLDAKKAVEIRKAYEQARVKPPVEGQPKAFENYAPAIQGLGDMKTYDNSSVVVAEVDVDLIQKNKNAQIVFAVALAQAEASTVEDDDYLSMSKKKPFVVSPRAQEQSFVGLPDLKDFAGQQTVELTKGLGHHKLLVLAPHNAFSSFAEGKDQQALVLVPNFLKP